MLEKNIDPAIYKALMNTISSGKLALNAYEKNSIDKGKIE